MARIAGTRSERIDVYEQITSRIIADLEQGVRPWTRPWTSGGAGSVSRPLRHTGQAYNGINVLLLWMQAAAQGFGNPVWMTFRQAQAYGGCVRKGERGTTVVYADQIIKTVEGDDLGAEDSERRIPFLKAYSVFNVAQIEGLPERFAQPEPPAPIAERIPQAEAFFAATKIEVRPGGDCACYVPSADIVRMPSFSAFADPVDYYATLSHEMTHATGHPSRLARDFSGRFGDHAYACEELVAELGAAFLCADLGLSLEPRADHAAYIASWLKVLKDDRRFIVSAAAQAQRAVDWLNRGGG